MSNAAALFRTSANDRDLLASGAGAFWTQRNAQDLLSGRVPSWRFGSKAASALPATSRTYDGAIHAPRVG